ncbi:unnamed protein product [Peniophora sp. CBMAI 1063]|nr:unnamed protein product [Peniophora sp. CBMAI 1063]
MLDIPQARYSNPSSSSTRHPRRPPPSQASSPGVSPEIPFAGPPPYLSIYSAVSNSAPGSSPIPSRASSPLPFLYSSAPSSASSELESDGEAPVLTRRRVTPRERPPRWWFSQSTLRRRRRESGWFLRQARRWTRAIVRSPFCPRQPWTILITLVLFSIFASSLTLGIIYALNPDKEALPWRAYCAVAIPSHDPPLVDAPVVSPDIFTIGAAPPPPEFPPAGFDDLPPAGVFLGVFSIDSSYDRRMLIRSTWATHDRSRNGAGPGDGGNGTSRTLVRFILGQPRKSWERRVQLEMDQYNDIVILPIAENMNSGKSHTFFSWAATMAYVPPVLVDTPHPRPKFSYANDSQAAPSPSRLAAHDPSLAKLDAASAQPRDWVRPDFVVKADDDSFVMLAELEARLRVGMYDSAAHQKRATSEVRAAQAHMRVALAHSGQASVTEIDNWEPEADPLVYWGYLVKQRFMAGELYALSWSLVTYAATDAGVRTHLRGAEDKQTASWMRIHPRADAIRWINERVWIYDHPRAGTVYSHGFLFPSEAARVRKGIKSYKELSATVDAKASVGEPSQGASLPVPTEWSASSVSTFGTRYAEPVAGLTARESVEALVEGSEMSRLYEGSILTPDLAWRQREGRATRYENKRLGGTVVVHFIKKNMWYLETALALLEGEDETERERETRLHRDRKPTWP